MARVISDTEFEELFTLHGAVKKLTDQIGWLTKILTALAGSPTKGLTGIVNVVSLSTGGTFQRISATSRLVNRAIIQNISTENVTIVSGSPNATAGQGIALNAAPATGLGGGSLPVGNIDLSTLFFVRASSGVTLAVYYEQ